ncbi:MAG TPA: HD domain-containing phosphohydrolase [Anaerolineaceae bacterium]|nr:HD domain-containing phosphohydrolase [Anaerolineaceae bacterium]
MPDRPSSPSTAKDHGALKITGIYLLIGVLWIAFSDEIAASLTSDPVILTRISMFKGWGYVLVTGLLLYSMIRRETATLRQTQVERELLLDENQRQKALLDAIFEADPSGLAVVVGPELRIGYANPAYHYCTPDPHLDPVDQLYRTVWSADPQNSYEEQVEEALYSGKPFICDGIERRLPDGRKFYFTFQVRRIQWNNDPAVLLILWDITQRKQSEEALLQAHAELETAYDLTLQGWVRALELREQETAEHSRRVVEWTISMANALRIDADSLPHIHRGALLHDIGKLGVPDSILLKPAALTSEEWDIMHRHPEFARDLLNEIPYLRKAIEIPYGHHECWDGTGYPQGIQAEAIPLAARIFSVVDVYDALLSDRPYRPAWVERDVRTYLREQKGRQFDPRIVDLFLEMVPSKT